MRSPEAELLEIDVARQQRLIAHWAPPTLTLLDVGEKRVIPSYSPMKLETDLRTAKSAPRGFFPGKSAADLLFRDADSANWQSFAGENAPEWIYKLADDQQAIVSRIITRLPRGSVQDQLRYFVVGGPGTGKTSVLLALLVSLSSRGKRVGLVISDELAAFLDSCGVNVGQFRRFTFSEFFGGGARVDVLLVDDPGSPTDIQKAMDDAYGASRCVVIAFDPSQLDTDLTDTEYRSLVTSNGVTPYALRQCYRQKDVTGQAAKRVIDRVAESSPFKADNKKQQFAEAHRNVFTTSNDLRFVNRGGMTKVFELARRQTVREVSRLIQARKAWGLPTPSVLVVVDEFTEAQDWRWGKAFGSREAHTIGLKDLRAVKGLEYQWVVVVVRATLFAELQSGFTGATRRVYQARRLLRIPFTRARDGIFMLVLPDVARPGVRDYFQWS